MSLPIDGARPRGAQTLVSTEPSAEPPTVGEAAPASPVGDVRSPEAQKAQAVTTGNAPGGKLVSASRAGDRAEVEKAEEFDFVFVGGGVGGGTAAADLARRGYKVLILDAGDAKHDITEKVPGYHFLAAERKESSANYKLEQELNLPEGEKQTKQDDYPRHWNSQANANFLVRPHESDLNYIAEITGDDSWRPKEFNKYFERMTDVQYRKAYKLAHRIGKALGIKKLQNLGGLGFGENIEKGEGFLKVSRPLPKDGLKDPKLLKIIASAIKAAAKEGTLGERLKAVLHEADPNDLAMGKQSMFTVLPTSVDEHGRRSSAQDYVDRVQDIFPDNLTVRTGAVGWYTIFDENKNAVGVKYLEGNHLHQADRMYDPEAKGTPKVVRAKYGVVSASGAMQTPAFLQHSGIGDAQKLEALGIPVVADRKGVGQGGQDRVEAAVIGELMEEFGFLKDATFTADAKTDPLLRQWHIEGKDAVLASNGHVGAILMKSDPSLPEPDLAIFILGGHFENFDEGFSKKATQYKDRLSIIVLKAHTKSATGTVEITSPDPTERPKITIKKFEGEAGLADLKGLVAGMKVGRKILEGLGKLLKREIAPGPNVKTDAELAADGQKRNFGHHFSSTAQMGHADDPMAVVDSKFAVIGVSNLFVVDQSIWPKLQGLFPVVGNMMAALKAADALDARAQAMKRAEEEDEEAAPPARARPKIA